MRMRTLCLFALLSLPLAAQAPPMAPPQLDTLVQRIALYPDPLLAQVMTASTFWDQFPRPPPGRTSTVTSQATPFRAPSKTTGCRRTRASSRSCRFPQPWT